MTMQALIRYADEPRTLRWSEWPRPAVGTRDVLVRIVRAAVCSTDVAIWAGSYRGRQPNVVPAMVGHEAAGVIEAVGDEVTDLAVGDRVALQVIWGHPHAPESMCGHDNLDPDWFHLGTADRPGAMADLIAIEAHHVVRIPDSIDWDNAALIEALSIAVNAMQRASLAVGENFVAVGPGGLGLLATQIAIRAGAARTIVAGLAGVDDARLEVARSLGVDHVVSVGKDMTQAAQAILDLTGGVGAQVVVDNGGTAGSTSLALEVAAPAARLAMTGFTPKVEIEPLRQIVRKGLSLHGIAASQRHHYGPAVRMIQAGLEPAQIISHRLPMSEATEGMELMLGRRATKVLLSA